MKINTCNILPVFHLLPCIQDLQLEVVSVGLENFLFHEVIYFAPKCLVPFSICSILWERMPQFNLVLHEKLFPIHLSLASHYSVDFYCVLLPTCMFMSEFSSILQFLK